MHRFVWDLRYPKPKALHYGYSIAAIWDEGTPVHPEGPLVVPGKYKAVLKIINKEYSKEFIVKPDPRVKATTKDFNEQLKFALELDAALNKTTELYYKVDDLIKSKLTESEIDSLKEIRKKLSDIDGTFAGLATDVQTADTAPTQGVRDVYRVYRKQLEEVAAEMNK